jgi:outer membrane lipoprotein LolB
LRAWVLALALLLAGCAGLQRQAPPAEAPRLAGRLSVNVAAGSGRASGGSASFELVGGPESGQLELTSPLGSLVARAQWQPGLVALRTPDGERRFETLDDLTREMLGEPVPVAALFDWLRGRPWAGAEHRERPQGFEQLGWRVDLSRQADRVLVATRLAEPVVTLRARLEGGDEGTP